MTECARCGDCCERVVPNMAVPDMRLRLQNPKCAGAARRELTKIVNMLGERVPASWPFKRTKPAYRCMHFNIVTRQCNAHDQRPLMCSRYPWYPPSAPLPMNKIPRDMSPRCSYIEDVRPMLPLTVL